MPKGVWTSLWIHTRGTEAVIAWINGRLWKVHHLTGRSTPTSLEAQSLTIKYDKIPQVLLLICPKNVCYPAEKNVFLSSNDISQTILQSQTTADYYENLGRRACVYTFMCGSTFL